MKVLNPRIHGYLDYGAVALLAVAPSLFGFSGMAAAICYFVAVVQLGMSLITAYPLSLAKIIPFTVHGGIELGVAIGLALSPWLFGFSHNDAARSFFIIAGVGLSLVFFVTNYRAADGYRQRPLRRDRVASHA
jgi:hypothetical protein